MKLLCMSDLHGYLPSIQWDEPGVVVIAGDIVPALREYHKHPGANGLQREWLRYMLIPWLKKIQQPVVLTWGNHDSCAEDGMVDGLPWPLHVHVLTNRGVTIEGVRFYGVPQQPEFCNWAFNEEDSADGLGKRWRAVDDGTDVLVSHGPPRGSCDGQNLGSKTQTAWLRSDLPNRPKVLICGHIHESGGETGRIGITDIYNVAIKDLQYKAVRQPRIVELC